MFLSIIVLNYKKPQLTLACIKSLYVQFEDEFKKKEIELIIVDNASGDDSVALIQNELTEKGYNNAVIIPNTQNEGFGAGCNLGAAKASGKYLLFLNNDTVVKDRGILDMVQYMEKHQDAAILGGQLRNSDGTLQPSAGKFYTPFYVLLLLIGMENYNLLNRNPKNISRVDWVKGAMLMMQKELFEKLKGFDANIFMYTEDMELCYRAKQANYLTYFYPSVEVLHTDQGSTNRSFAIIHIYKSLLYFYKKHRSYNEYLFLKSLLKLKALVLYTAGQVLRKPYLVQTYAKALEVTR